MGGVLGGLVSFVSAATLLEISENRFFGVYFGIVFCLVGPVIMWRVLASSGASRVLKCFMVLLSLLVVAGGVSCFVVDHNGETLGIPPLAIIPFYILIGTTVSFAVMFGLVDLVNAAFASNAGVPWVENQRQIILVLVSSLMLGAVNGIVLGLLEFLRIDKNHFRGFLRQEVIVVPVGSLVGCVTGFLARKFAPVRADDDELDALWAARAKRAANGVAGFDDGL